MTPGITENTTKGKGKTMERKNDSRHGEEAARAASGTYRPELAFYHPNAKGTGCAVKFSLHPAHDDTAGSMFLTAANQMTVGGRGEGRAFPKFDWDNRICVKLDFADLCRFLQVLRGECESIDDGRGLYHRRADVTTTIKFRHVVEPDTCYSLELYRNSGREGATTAAAHILFGQAEALGLSEVFSRMLPVVCFGLPSSYARPSAAPRGEKGDEHAA